VKKYLLALLFFIPVLGCQPESDSIGTSTPIVTSAPSSVTSTAYPEITSTLTSTPQPPLQEREWTPKTVLLRLDFIPGEGERFSGPPHFILYADGNLFLEYPLIAGIPYGDQQMLFKKLERGEMCKILNTLDQVGFLDYDPSDYTLNVTGTSGAYIQVNAWKSHKKVYPHLSKYITEELTGQIDPNLAEVGFPIISPALRNAYYLLMDYPADGLEVYQPAKFAVWLSPLDPENFSDIKWEQWNFAALSLAGMLSRIDSGNGNFLILDGATPKALYKFLNNSFSTRYYYEIDKRGERKYYVFYIRPLLPHEIPQDHGMFAMEENITLSNLKLKCHPSDGIISIPAPNLIFSVP
jgi:hypothetical protein